MNRLLSSSFRLVSVRRSFVLASLLASTIPACSPDDVCSDSCGDAGAKGSGGAKPSTGGAPTGGDEGSGGLPARGGLDGNAGEASTGTGGSAGETAGVGGMASLEKGPEVTSVSIDGQSVEPGGTLSGVHEGAKIIVNFSRAMDTLSVEKAFVARSEESSLSSFVVAWNEENTELTLILRSRVKYPEIGSPEEGAQQLGFLLTRSAKDEEGEALSEEFFVTFSLLRRLTQFIEPDLANSGIAYGNVPYDYVQEVDGQVVPTQYTDSFGLSGDNCPWLDPENDYDPVRTKDIVRAQFPYSAARNFSSTPGRHGSNPRGTRVAIYSFPLANIPRSGLERATLKLAKWERVKPDTSDRDGDGSRTDYVPYYSDISASYDFLFSVDALPSFALPESKTSYEAQLVFGTSSWRANLINSDGAEYSKGFGFFAFNVTDLVEDGIDEGDPWAMYRADFDGLPVIKDDPFTACVTMGLEAVSLVE